METQPVISEKLTFARLLILAGCFAALFFAISGESLWIDEANTAMKAIQPDFKNWWREMQAISGSDLQMPLYMIYIWAFAKVCGATEFVLRLANLPWLFLGLGVCLKAFSARKNLCIGIALATVTSPFVWFYLNEARPYAMQLGASFLVFGALVRLFSDPPLSRTRQRQWSLALAVGIIFLSGSSMLGVIWAGAALLSAAFVGGKERTKKILCQTPLVWLVTLLMLLSLGAYFIWTLKSGARASAAASTGIKNLAFVFYELLGFSGLGPGRLEIRASGLGSFRQYAPALIAYAISVATILVTAWRRRDKIAAPKIFFWPIIFLSVATAFLFLVGYVTHFRVLARHFTPLAVAILFFIGSGLSCNWLFCGLKGKMLVGIFLGLSLFSCLSLRYVSRHQKDDYRSAASIANAELRRGKTVWWNADIAGAEYYQVPISPTPVDGKAWFVMNSQPDFVFAQTPDVVVASKPDLYDAESTLAKFFQVHNYVRQTNFPAFSIWVKSEK